MLGDWKDFFSKTILDRGYAYYFEDRVDNLVFASDEIHADVRGSNIYTVCVGVEEMGISSLDCDCPYSQAGYGCKHMAAVLFAVEALGDRFFTDSQTGLEASLELLPQIHPDDLRRFLAEQMQNFPALAKIFFDRFAPPVTSDRWIKEWPDALERFFRRWPLAAVEGKRELFWQETSELLEIMAAAGDAAKSDDFSDVLASVDYWLQRWAPYTIAMNDQGWYQVRDSLTGYVRDWIEAKDGDEHHEILLWLTYLLIDRSKTRAVIPGFADLYFEHYRSPDDLRYKLGALERLLENKFLLRLGASNSQFGVFPWLERLADVHRQLGEHTEARAVWRKHLADARSWYAATSYFFEQKDYHHTLDLLIEAKQLFAGNPVDVNAFALSIIECHLQLGNQSKARDESRRCVVSYASDPSEDLGRHRELFSEDEWPSERATMIEQIVACGYDPAPVYVNEGMLAELLSVVLADPDSEVFWKYEPLLAKEYPQELLPILLRRLQTQAEASRTRPKYKELNKLLSRLHRYPNGKQTRQELLGRWKEQFSTRTAMMQELNLSWR